MGKLPIEAKVTYDGPRDLECAQRKAHPDTQSIPLIVFSSQTSGWLARKIRKLVRGFWHQAINALNSDCD